MRDTLNRQAQAQQTQALWAPAPHAPVTQVPPCTSHPHLPGVSWQPHMSRLFNRLVSQWGWESPSTPPLTNLWALAVRMPMVTGGRELKAKMITPSLPVTPGEHERGPPLG